MCTADSKSTSDSTSAFQAMVRHYESRGWDVRTINHAALRATVRSTVAPEGDDTCDLTIQVVVTASDCRKLWVDSQGHVQETDVPC